MGGSDLILTFAGGGIGSLTRWLLSVVVAQRYSRPFPLTTLLVNVSGAFLIGFLTTLFEVDWMDRFGHPLNTFVLTGVLGGYTTFSAFELDWSALVRDRRHGTAAVWVVGTVVGGLAAAVVGRALARVF